MAIAPRALIAKRSRGDKITHYLIEGNRRFTSIETVARMADKGLITDVSSYKDVFVRSHPDNTENNNLRNLPDRS